MMHNTCRYCGAGTEMRKDPKSGRWQSCIVGTTVRHRCQHRTTRRSTDNLSKLH